MGYYSIAMPSTISRWATPAPWLGCSLLSSPSSPPLSSKHPDAGSSIRVMGGNETQSTPAHPTSAVQACCLSVPSHHLCCPLFVAGLYLAQTIAANFHIATGVDSQPIYLEQLPSGADLHSFF